MERRTISPLEVRLIEKAVANAIEIASEKGTIEQFVKALVYAACPDPIEMHPVQFLGQALSTFDAMLNNPRS